MQQRGLIYCGAPEFHNTHIMDGKVRIPVLYTIWYFSDEQTCKTQGELRHWRPLDVFFRELKDRQDASPRLCIYRQFVAIPQLIARFSPDRPLFLNLSVRMVMEKKEEAENRHRAIQAWLRKTERSRKDLTLFDGKTSSSRAGVVRREKARNFENHQHSRPSCRNGLEVSSNIIVVPSNEYLRNDRRKAISERTESSISEAESKEAAFGIVSALAVNAQFFSPSCFSPDDGLDLESDSDDTLIGCAVALS
ncbi:hypothetical protein C0993_012182 [Termitomyces sp. T159_Od127]|nr:hypothetical protein C0993_012182 [Termitomyces sp. T159_Od127]